MKDVIAQKLGIKEEFINEKNGEYLIKGVDTAIVVNKDNSDIFKDYEHLSVGAFNKSRE